MGTRKASRKRTSTERRWTGQELPTVTCCTSMIRTTSPTDGTKTKTHDRVKAVIVDEKIIIEKIMFKQKELLYSMS